MKRPSWPVRQLKNNVFAVCLATLSVRGHTQSRKRYLQRSFSALSTRHMHNVGKIDALGLTTTEHCFSYTSVFSPRIVMFHVQSQRLSHQSRGACSQRLRLVVLALRMTPSPLRSEARIPPFLPTANDLVASLACYKLSAWSSVLMLITLSDPHLHDQGHQSQVASSTRLSLSCNVVTWMPESSCS